jgi:hypothetical protein
MMPDSWRYSPAWLLIAVVAVMFALGVAVPLEIESYTAGQQKIVLDESLESSFRISYIGQWSGFGNHWYNYTVAYAAPGLVWGDLWMTVYFNGTSIEIPPFGAEAVVNHATVGVFEFESGNWGPKGAVAPVVVGQTLSINTAAVGGDGNILFVSAVNGSFQGTFSLYIP